jgi:hypothetical protein
LGLRFVQSPEARMSVPPQGTRLRWRKTVMVKGLRIAIAAVICVLGGATGTFFAARAQHQPWAVIPFSHCLCGNTWCPWQVGLEDCTCRIEVDTNWTFPRCNCGPEFNPDTCWMWTDYWFWCSGTCLETEDVCEPAWFGCDW